MNKMLLMLLFLAFVKGAWADTSTLTAASDNTLIEDFSFINHSNGSGDAIYVGNTQRVGERRGLLRFDLSSIPANASIQSVTLKLYLIKTHGDVATLNLHRLLSSWGEGASNGFGGGGAPAETGDATWAYRFFNTSQVWTTPGGDFSPTSSIIALVDPGLGSLQNLSSPQMAVDVQQWVNQPATNFGWMLKSSTSTAKAYASRENADTTIRPQLVVTWMPAQQVVADGDAPLPLWSLLLLGGGLMAVATRFRRN